MVEGNSGWSGFYHFIGEMRGGNHVRTPISFNVKTNTNVHMMSQSGCGLTLQSPCYECCDKVPEQKCYGEHILDAGLVYNLPTTASKKKGKRKKKGVKVS